METINKIMETASKVADNAVKSATNLTAAGKQMVDNFALENELGKAQKQLGALVYSLKKSGDTNEDLLNRYIEDIDVIFSKIELSKNNAAKASSGEFCATCASQINDGDNFCAKCGERVKQDDAKTEACE